MKRMLRGMSKRELAELPPFPFPKELFPPGTFPEGVRFSAMGLAGGMPPQVKLSCPPSFCAAVTARALVCVSLVSVMHE